MPYERKQHTIDTFRLALRECLGSEFRQKLVRRRQLRELLVDVGACNARHKFRTMTLRQAWNDKKTSPALLKWWLLRVFQNSGTDELRKVLDNIDSVAVALSQGNSWQTTEKRRAQAIREWFTPDGSLRRPWQS